MERTGPWPLRHPAASIVGEKEMGTIKQFMVTPIGTGELLVAKTAPTLAMGSSRSFRAY